MLPIHTGGHEGDCPEQVPLEWFTLVIGQQSFFSFFFFRASPGPNSLREARLLCFAVTSKPEQWTTNIIIFFFPMWYNWYNSTV